MADDETLRPKSEFTPIEMDVAFTRDSDTGLNQLLAYAGVPSFMRRRYTKDLSGVDIAYTGIPFDHSMMNRPGSRYGPRAIREQSALLAWGAPYRWDFSPFDEIKVVDYGDVGFDHGDLTEVPARIQAHIKGILDQGAASLSIGGDHFVTYPILKAHHEKYGPLSLIHFDAHSDTWEDLDSDRVDHGTMFYHAIKEGLIVPEHSAQIGIRTHNKDTWGMNIFDPDQIEDEGPVSIAEQVKEIVGDRPVYLTFDIDALDPAFAPGTGTPVTGGMTTGQAHRLIRALAGIQLVGMDVVEVSPPYDHGDITAIAGAELAHDMVALWAYYRRENNK
jgi:agmatinase